jgi:hypothetical protein
VTDLFLGVIAAAVLVMAAIQVAAVVAVARAARRIDRIADRFERDIQPVVASLQALTADAARATALAVTQVERADRLFSDLSRRVEQTLVTVQETLLAPAREGFAWLSGLKAVLATLRDLKPSPQPAGVDEDDALFIG